MRELKFVGGLTAAIIEEPEIGGMPYQVGGDVKVFRLDKVSCGTVDEAGRCRVTLDGGETFFVTRDDFRKLMSEVCAHTFGGGELWG